jgi:hypothetical protein
MPRLTVILARQGRRLLCRELEAAIAHFDLPPNDLDANAAVGAIAAGAIKHEANDLLRRRARRLGTGKRKLRGFPNARPHRICDRLLRLLRSASLLWATFAVVTE